MISGDTIFALSSGPGRAGVALIRVSGCHAGRCLRRLAGNLPAERKAVLRVLRAPQSRDVIDNALVLWFKAPKSFTGEDIAEFHVHGGRAVVQALLDALAAMPGCRMAEAGEFARRAFENGKLDLTEAEGLADLIDAETDAQRRQALRQADGALARLYEGWRAELIEALALQEAAIDFSDEEDVGAGVSKPVASIVGRLESAIAEHLADANRGEILRDGFHVVLAGAPNAGKSSLLNALARRDVAIVSELAGTTRDVIEVRLDLEGLPVVVSDTAGIREAGGEIEREGVRRAVARARSADLVIWLVDALDPVPVPPCGVSDQGAAVLPVLNKIDRFSGGPPKGLPADGLAISALKGTGIDGLTAKLAAILHDRIGKDEAPVLTRARHREQLRRCASALAAFQAGNRGESELRAEDLRLAATALGRITGRVDVEDLLDRIFASFCIGK